MILKFGILPVFSKNIMILSGISQMQIYLFVLFRSIATLELILGGVDFRLFGKIDMKGPYSWQILAKKIMF